MGLIYLRYSIPSPSPEKVLSSLIRSQIPFNKPTKEEDALCFSANVFSRKAVILWAKKENFKISAEYQGTIPAFFAFKHRIGIFLGIIVSLFLIYLSTFYVWSVRIEGNNSITDAEIIKLLGECGFKEGIHKKSVDVNEIQNAVLGRCHELSFISVNVHGMVADIVVHERQTAPKAINESMPYNLVADSDGVIVSSLILDGQTLFKTGDTVFKGQLLVSGLTDSTSGIIGITHARGKVYARTDRVLTFEIPFEETAIKYNKDESITGYRILGKSFYRKPKNLTGNYDVTIKEEKVKFLGLLLPITKEIRHVKHYTLENVMLSRDEAEERAYDEYRRYISTELDSAELLNEVFSVEEKEDGIVLTVEVTAIENIATEKKFELTE